MKSLRAGLLLCLLGIIWGDVKGQDPQFSQFYATPLYLNPAFAGATQVSRVGLNYRNQWPSMDASYVTYSAWADHFFIDANSGVGLVVLSDREDLAGMKMNYVAAQYAYQLGFLQNWTFRPGFEASYVMKSLDYSRLTFGDQYDDNGYQGPSSEVLNSDWMVNYFDMALGGVFYNNNFWGGFAVHHVLSPNTAFISGVSDKLPRKYSIHAGYRIPLKKETTRHIYYDRNQKSIDLYPAINYKLQGEFQQLDLGMYLTYTPVSVGIWYRGVPVNILGNYNNSEAIIFSLGLNTRGLNIGYSFDYTLSGLGISSGGAHEISLIYEFFLGDPRKPPKSVRQIPCPRI